ncbi:sesquipedalian-1 isoform X1 [Polyodon spathula]|uniref:sesquipedalian-1 isoform X1 n=2 Tax=Polyodon spathula TaxID=7913 RepID=UPI001B7E72CD|nr:sesquipedalian-1 isoform X1 [Polyodon spathula]XP_041094695.1 sesquipedalian-1 isoform X1 [Polyodon spathula]XP_041094696.1 sesquipedalian-1 isoform X1 [Polyodon spathula]XP_041094698.1 sesquipedalian-1 isoform X1 [Polyodon spathula]
MITAHLPSPRGRSISVSLSDSRMKLHEKQFVRHASGPSPVDKEGFLSKKGESRPTYQRRWFSLRGNLLFYYEKRGDPGPLGVIVLEGCSVQLCESCAGDFAFAIVFQGPGLRTYKLTADDQHEQESWVKALLSAHFGYLQMLLLDLEKMYQEVSGNTKPLVLGPAPGPALPGKEGRGYAASQLQAPPPSGKAKKSPKLWPKRQAQVSPTLAETPPTVGVVARVEEWSVVDDTPLEAFVVLHARYGQEVGEAREEWRKKRGEVLSDLIDLG